MFKGLFNSIIILPVLMAVLLAASRRGRSALTPLIALFVTYGVFYMLLLYYLRRRWTG
jgi:hypothetical protein